MKRLIAIFVFALGVAASAQETGTNVAPTNAVPAVAPKVASTAPVDPLSFEAFKVIAQRNIFDPSRSAPGASRDDRPKERPKPTEAFTLLGSISYEKGDFAFFDGTRSEYRESRRFHRRLQGRGRRGQASHA